MTDNQIGSSSPQINREGGLPVFFYPVVILLLVGTGAGLILNFPSLWLWAMQTCAILITLFMVGQAMAMQRNDARTIQLQLNELMRRGQMSFQRPAPDDRRPQVSEPTGPVRREARPRPPQRKPETAERTRQSSPPSTEPGNPAPEGGVASQPRRSSRSRRRRKPTTEE